MSKKRHGSRSDYNKGCRCKTCIAANSAYNFARRLAGRWDAPLAGHLLVSESPTIDGGRRIVPAEVIVEAIDNLAAEIRIEALSVLWHRSRKGKGKLA